MSVVESYLPFVFVCWIVNWLDSIGLFFNIPSSCGLTALSRIYTRSVDFFPKFKVSRFFRCNKKWLSCYFALWEIKARKCSDVILWKSRWNFIIGDAYMFLPIDQLAVGQKCLETKEENFKRSSASKIKRKSLKIYRYYIRGSCDP